MRIKRILAGLGVVAAAAVLTACSGGTMTSTAGVQPAAATVSTSDTPVAQPSTASTSDTSSRTADKGDVKPADKPQMAPGVPCTITAKACVDLSAHKAWLLDDGKIVYGPVATMPGKTGSTTPLGTWHVLYKEKMHLSKEFNNAPMPNSVFFYPGVAFHQGSLGRYSNGCVHLSQTSSLKFFDTLDKGDEVQVVR